MDPDWAYNHTQGVINQAFFYELVRRAGQANVQADPGLLGNVLRQARSISHLNAYANQPPLPLFALPTMPPHQLPLIAHPNPVAQPNLVVQPNPIVRVIPTPIRRPDEAETNNQGVQRPMAVVAHPPPAKPFPVVRREQPLQRSHSEGSSAFKALSWPQALANISPIQGVNPHPAGDEGAVSKDSSFLSATSEVLPMPESHSEGTSADASGLTTPSEESHERSIQLSNFTSGSNAASGSDAASSQASVDASTQTPTKPTGKVKTPSPKRGDRVKKSLFTELVKNAIVAGDKAMMKSSADIFGRQSRALARRRPSPSTSESSTPQSQADSKGKCPIHYSSSAYGAAVREKPGKLPNLICTCSPEERRLDSLCVVCESVVCQCHPDRHEVLPDSSRRSASTPARTMATRQGGNPLGHFDKETHAFVKNK